MSPAPIHRRCRPGSGAAPSPGRPPPICGRSERRRRPAPSARHRRPPGSRRRDRAPGRGAGHDIRPGHDSCRGPPDRRTRCGAAAGDRDRAAPPPAAPDRAGPRRAAVLRGHPGSSRCRPAPATSRSRRHPRPGTVRRAPARTTRGRGSAAIRPGRLSAGCRPDRGAGRAGHRSPDSPVSGRRCRRRHGSWCGGPARGRKGRRSWRRRTPRREGR
jgi:hypothetical protein